VWFSTDLFGFSVLWKRRRLRALWWLMLGLSRAVLGLVMVFGAAVIGEEKKIKPLELTAMMVGTVGLICSRVIVFEGEGFGGF
jgi:presenilin-like A22 family membrane protease